MHARRVAVAPWLIIAAMTCTWIACERHEDAGAQATPGPQAPPPRPPATPPPAPTPAPIDTSTFAPVIREVATAGTLPERIVFEFYRPLVDRAGPAGSDTRATLTPPVEGQLVFTGPSSLAFVPTGGSAGFAFGTAYEVALESVESPGGRLTPPKSKPWVHRFETPAFAFLGHEVLELDVKKRRLRIELNFSGPVDPKAVQPLARWTAADAELTGAKYSVGSTPSRVTATLSSPAITEDANVFFELKSGLLPSSGRSAPAPGTKSSVLLSAKERIDIVGVELREGANGPFFELHCRAADVNAPRPQILEAPGTAARTDESSPYEERYPGPACDVDPDEVVRVARLSPASKMTAATSRGGFSLFPETLRRGAATLTLGAGLKTRDGAVLLGRWEKAFSVPARRPRVSIPGVGRYLPRSAWRSLPISHLNVEAASVVVRHVPPENVPFWLSSGEAEKADQRTSDLLARRNIPLGGEPDVERTSFVDLSNVVPAETRGLVEVTIADPGSDATPAVGRLFLTDLSLIAKRSVAPGGGATRETIRVWALGTETTEPLAGVEVSAVRRSGKALARCTTSAAEGCLLSIPADPVDEAGSFALLARRGEDFTALRYDDVRTQQDDADVGGEAFASTTPYRAVAYTDRGVYRPGETAHLVAVVRTASGVAPQTGLPVELVVVDPRGRPLRKELHKTNEAGLVAVDLAFEAFSETGAYSVSLSIAGAKVGGETIKVEEFVPERMKVSVKPLASGYLLAPKRPGAAAEPSPVRFEVEAAYLFGGSAEGSEASVTCRVEPATFAPKESAGFTFGTWTQDRPRPFDFGDDSTQLDTAGRGTLDCSAPEGSEGFRGAGRLVARVAVLEAGSGRATQAVASVPVHPERFYVGLQSGARSARARAPFTVTGIVVDWDGKPVMTVPRVELELLRLEDEYGAWWSDEEGGEERHERRLRPVLDGRASVEVKGGRFELQLTPSLDGEAFLVRARAGAAETDLTIAGSAPRYGWAPGQERADATPKPQKPWPLALEVPKSLRVGEAATFKVQVPYRGRLLWSAETDEVLAAEWRSVEPGENSWQLPLKAFAPNVYVSALLVKDPHLESKESFTPQRAFGVVSVPVEPTPFAHTVKLGVPAEVRSNEALDVTLDVGPVDGPTYATVAAVDEGILSLTGFDSPDPLRALYARRALGVETYETVGWTVLVPPAASAKKTGGDAEDESPGAEARVQPVRPVALWSGLVKLGADGKGRVRFQVPQYRGRLRVMAVTAGASRVGAATAHVTVRDPITLQTTLPRFLVHGDRVEIPVFVTNLAGKVLDVTVSLSTENLPVPGLTAAAVQDSPLELLGKDKGQVRLGDGKSATLVFQARAAKSVGAARLTVVARGGGFESRDALDVPFAPSGPRERLVKRIELKSAPVDLKPHLSGWVPTTERSTVWVTANPYGEAFDHLKWLVQYPHGCIEQTTSSLRPLLFLSKLMGSVDPTLAGAEDVDSKVAHGINRLLSMQTAAGGFAYWPGQTEPLAWGTAYATHALLDARKAGYAVPPERLDRALEWAGEVLTRIESGGRRVGGHYDDHDGGAEPYLHYVLALAGKGRPASAARLVERLQSAAARGTTTDRGEQAEQVYMLQAALHLSGDRRFEKELRAPDASPLVDQRSNGWSFYSDRRRRGFLLSTFSDLFGADPAGEPLAQLVAAGLTGRSGGYTTQEVTWTVTGLGKRLGALASGTFGVPVLLAAGKRVEAKPNPNAQSSERTFALARASEYPSLTLSTELAGDARAWAILSSEGVRQDGKCRVGGEGLRVRRTVRTPTGQPVSIHEKPTALGALLYVELEVTNTTSELVRNLALVARSPAGWEIENPRLGRGGGRDWIVEEHLWPVEAMDVRDDRLAVFGSLAARETKRFVFAVRAVVSGTFTLPPVEVEAMYDPSRWAREAGGLVEVEGPWSDFLL